MDAFIMPVQLRWSDFDPNFHLRHSVYYDWGAMCRLEFLSRHGLGIKVMEESHFGPILWKEECVFRKEIRMGDDVKLDIQLSKARQDFSRWSIQHTITRNGDVAALISVDGAWIDTEKRKLATPPPIVVEVFSSMPKKEEFVWI